jgi:AraC-like DNA-binding protein
MTRERRIVITTDPGVSLLDLGGPLETFRVAAEFDRSEGEFEETEDRIEVDAEVCGYSGEEQMRAVFVRVLKTPPREYRKHFATSKTATVSPAAR